MNLTSKRISRFLFILFLLFTTVIKAQTLEPHWWHPDGVVNAIVKDPVTNVVYLGGNFTHVGPATPHGVQANLSTAVVDENYSFPNNTVRAAVSDNAGGWYIAGDFTAVGDSVRNRIAHINGSGQVTSWNPNANGTVRSIVLSNNLLYVAGDFTSVGGLGRNRLAAINTSTGVPTSWNPNSDSPVNAIVKYGNLIYAGGGFYNIAGTVRQGLCAIDSTSGVATAWNPGTNFPVFSLCVSGTTLYAGGLFTTIAAQTRNRMASFNLSTGAITAWNPNSNNSVLSIAVNGSTVYAGGAFTTIGGQTRNRIAALDGTTGLATGWNPNASDVVNALAISGSSIYVGGVFNTIGGQTRNKMAALDLATGLATSWIANASNIVNALALSPTMIYIGGAFTSIGGEARNSLAALDPVTGQLTPWNPNANGIVHSLVSSGNLIYAGGTFTTIGGVTRNRLAAIDNTSGLLNTWNPSVNGTVYAVAKSGTVIYVGGAFTVAGGASRQNAAAIDSTSGTATSWVANVTSNVFSIATLGSYVYIAGDFTSVNGLARARLAQLNNTTGTATSWNTPIDNTVYSIHISNNILYAGGLFTTVGAGVTTRNRIAAYSMTGALQGWNPNADGTVNSVFGYNGTVYVGGSFTTIGAQSRNSFAAINATTGVATSWNPNTDGIVGAILRVEDTIYIGGTMTKAGGYSRKNFAVYQVPCAAPIISSQSNSQSVCANSNLTLSASVSGSALSYQWKKGTSNVGTNTPTLTINNITAGDAGNYTLEITGACGNVTSSVITITVNALPAQPTITAGGSTSICSGSSVSLTSTAGTTYLWSNGATTQSINASTAGTYTVQVTNAAGCQSIASAGTTVTVNALPATPTITAGGPTTFCSGGTVSLTSTAGTSYLWSNGAITQSINATTSGTYTAQITNAAGCLSAASTGISVTVNDGVIAQPIAATLSSVCSGTSTTITTTSSETGVYYYLRNDSDNSVIAGPVAGTGGSLSFNTGPLTNTTTFNVLGSNPVITNYALDLDGVNDYVTMGTSNRGIVGALTVSARVRTTVTGASQFIVDKYLSGGIGFYLFINATGQASFQGRDVAGGIKSSGLSTTMVADNQWHTVTGVVRSTGWEIWVDGVLENSGAYSLGGTGLGTTAALLVGQFGGTYCPIEIDQVALWNAALTPATITANATGCLNGNEANLVAFFPFNEGTGTTAIDYSPSAINGTLTNMTVPAAWINGATSFCGGTCDNEMANLATVTITTAPAQPTISAGGSTTFCAGGSVTLTSSAGPSYLWSNGATTQSINVTTAGTYSVQVGSGSCQSVASTGTTVTVNALPATPTVTAGGPTTFCAGGSVTLTSSAGTSYLWSNGATTASISPTTSGTYSVQVTNAAGCQSAASTGTSVTVNSLPTTPTITAGGPTTFCAGGSVTLTSSAGNSYLWSNGATTASISPTTAGTYSVQVTNAAGCQSTASTGTTVTVNANPATPTITAGGPTTFCAGGSVTLTASVGTSYLWSNGATTASISPTAAGTYSVQVTNAAGCQSTASTGTTVTVNANPATPTITAGGPTTFCAGGSVTLTSSAGITYLWSNGATTASISPTTTGTYSVQVTNAAGCQSTASAGTSVTVNAVPAQPSITAGGPTTFCSGGSVTLTSSPGTSYLWTGGSLSSSINPSSSGTFTVQVTNAAGCQSIPSSPVTVTVHSLPNAPIISPSGPTTFCAGGSVNLASSAGITYLWSNGSTNFSINPTTSGTFTVQITDPNGCLSPASAPTTVTVNPNPVISLGTVSNPTSCTTANGSIQVSGTGTGNLSWSGAASGTLTNVALPTTISSLTNGSYNITLTNGNGCTSNVINGVLTAPAAPAAPTISAAGGTNLCAGQSVVLNSTTGTSYLWSNGETTSSITASVTGNYSVSITDASGCTSPSSNVITVTVHPQPTISAGTLTNPSSCVILDGSIQVSGTGTGDLSWSGGAVGSVNGVSLPYTIPNLGQGSYSIVHTDANGCNSATLVVNLTAPNAPAAPTISANGATTFCQGGSVDLTASTGTSYLWSNGETTATISVNSPGTYSVIITDANGCTSPSSVGTVVVVDQMPDLTVSMTANVITASQSGATYQWVDCLNGNAPISGATGQSFTPVSNGSYACEISFGTCSGISSCRVISTVGLDENNSKQVQIYPNPTTSILNISITDENSVEGNIYTSEGKFVLQFNGNSVDVSSLARGVYIVEIKYENANQRIRFIKE